MVVEGRNTRFAYKEPSVVGPRAYCHGRSQQLFLSRIFLLHEVALRKGGKSSALRLSLGDFQRECDRCCVIAHVLEAMLVAAAPDGSPLFDPDIISQMTQRAIEGILVLFDVWSTLLSFFELYHCIQLKAFQGGWQTESFISHPSLLRDFHSDVDTWLACADSNWKPETTSIFTEHMPKTSAPDRSQEIAAADAKHVALTADAQKAQYEADTLALARDVAQVGQLYKEVVSSEHARRTEKILHLRAQNAIGASIITDWMNSHLSIHSGPIKSLQNVIDRVWGDQTWC